MRIQWLPSVHHRPLHQDALEVLCADAIIASLRRRMSLDGLFSILDDEAFNEVKAGIIDTITDFYPEERE